MHLIISKEQICYRFGKHFELPLLAQSILMIIAMLAMVEACVRVKNQSEIIQSKQHSLKGQYHLYRASDNMSSIGGIWCFVAPDGCDSFTGRNQIINKLEKTCLF